MCQETKLSGRAYPDGLKLSNNKFAVKAFYDKNDNLQYQVFKKRNRNFINKIKKIPVLRGILLVFLIMWGILKNAVKRPGKYWIIFLIIILDLLYYYFSGNNGGTGIINYLLLFIYIFIPLVLIVIFRKKIGETLKYHGAEHKVVNYYENNSKGKIEDYSRIHRRCGSNLVFYYLLFNLIAFILNIDLYLNVYLLFLINLGLAYEVAKRTPEKLLFIPGVFQSLVTKEPDQKHITAASKALEKLLVLSDQKQNKLR